jgi:hypothetical protein
MAVRVKVFLRLRFILYQMSASVSVLNLLLFGPLKEFFSVLVRNKKKLYRGAELSNMDLQPSLRIQITRKESSLTEFIAGMPTLRFR